jgi:hypothetical protein
MTGSNTRNFAVEFILLPHHFFDASGFAGGSLPSLCLSVCEEAHRKLLVTEFYAAVAAVALAAAGGPTIV